MSAGLGDSSVSQQSIFCRSKAGTTLSHAQSLLRCAVETGSSVVQTVLHRTPAAFSAGQLSAGPARILMHQPQHAPARKLLLSCPGQSHSQLCAGRRHAGSCSTGTGPAGSHKLLRLAKQLSGKGAKGRPPAAAAQPEPAPKADGAVSARMPRDTQRASEGLKAEQKLNSLDAGAAMLNLEDEDADLLSQARAQLCAGREACTCASRTYLWPEHCSSSSRSWSWKPSLRTCWHRGVQRW